MKKDDAVYLGHIVDLADRISQRVKGKSRDIFHSDEDPRIVHDYMIVDEEIVWDVVSLELPKFIRKITPLIRPEHR